MKNFKKMFFLLFTAMLFPIFGVVGGGDSTNEDDSTNDDDSKNDDSTNEDDSKNDDDSKTNDDSKTKDERVIFDNQKQFDAIVNRKVSKAIKAARAAEENEKKKSEMTETQRLQQEKEDAEKSANLKVEEANKKLIKSEVMMKSKDLGIIDYSAAYKLMEMDDIEVDDDGTVHGVEKALKILVAEKAYLLNANNRPSKTGDDTNDESSVKSKKTTGNDFNSIIRRAAGRF